MEASASQEEFQSEKKFEERVKHFLNKTGVEKQAEVLSNVKKLGKQHLNYSLPDEIIEKIVELHNQKSDVGPLISLLKEFKKFKPQLFEETLKLANITKTHSDPYFSVEALLHIAKKNASPLVENHEKISEDFFKEILKHSIKISENRVNPAHFIRIAPHVDKAKLEELAKQVELVHAQAENRSLNPAHEFKTLRVLIQNKIIQPEELNEVASELFKIHENLKKIHENLKKEEQFDKTPETLTAETFEKLIKKVKKLKTKTQLLQELKETSASMEKLQLEKAKTRVENRFQKKKLKAMKAELKAKQVEQGILKLLSKTPASKSQIRSRLHANWEVVGLTLRKLEQEGKIKSETRKTLGKFKTYKLV